MSARGGVHFLDAALQPTCLRARRAGVHEAVAGRRRGLAGQRGPARIVAIRLDRGLQQLRHGRTQEELRPFSVVRGEFLFDFAHASRHACRRQCVELVFRHHVLSPVSSPSFPWLVLQRPPFETRKADVLVVNRDDVVPGLSQNREHRPVRRHADPGERADLVRAIREFAQRGDPQLLHDAIETRGRHRMRASQAAQRPAVPLVRADHEQRGAFVFDEGLTDDPDVFPRIDGRLAALGGPH